MKRLVYIYIQTVLTIVCNAQGLINNGAQLVLTNGANVYIDGVTGNYTNQAGGLINNSTVGGTVTLLGNWINNAANVAFNNDGATVQLAGVNQSIGGTNTTTFFNLSSLGSGIKTLNVNTTVGGISSLTGVLALGALPLDLNSRTLTISNPLPAAITFGAGYIISETNLAVNPSIVTWIMSSPGAHIYPFGVSGTQIPFTFNKTTVVGSSNISVSTRATLSSNNTPWAGLSSVPSVTHMYSPIIGGDGSVQTVIDRWWDITASSPVTANLTFTYRGVENTTSMSPTGTFGAQHWNGAGWDPTVGSGAGVTSGVGTVVVLGANTFSPWILSTLSVPLPLELMEFDSECYNNKKSERMIKWVTATETNNAYFTIERSADALNFIPVAKIEGAGNSMQKRSYSWIDNYIAEDADLIYYRLKQTDIDGTSKTYKAISSLCNDAGELAILNAQDNQGQSLEVLFNTSHSGLHEFIVHDVLGKLICSKKENLTVNGKQSVRFITGDIVSGVYFITLTDGIDLVVKKVILQ